MTAVLDVLPPQSQQRSKSVAGYEALIRTHIMEARANGGEIQCRLRHVGLRIIFRRQPHFRRYVRRSGSVLIATLGGWRRSMNQKKLVYGNSTPSGTMHVDNTKETDLDLRASPRVETRTDAPPFRWQAMRPEIVDDPRHTQEAKDRKSVV